MCGIAGIVDFSDTGPEDVKAVRAAIHSIRHRGPDCQEVWQDGPAVLGHARLSIIDLSSAADQPMRDSSGRVGIAYNGEIYNFKSLRSLLAGRGRTFHTASDTEVLLQAYLEWGKTALSKLSGMFAVAVWDGNLRRLVLARDPMGIKPLYYLHTGSRLLFSSEIKAILAMRPGARYALDPRALQSYLWFGNATGIDTMYAPIRRLLPGEVLTFEQGEIRCEHFWTIAGVKAVRDDFPTAVNWVRALLSDAVGSHLVSDVPVGIMLSGGIDSSAIATFAARASAKRLKTFSVAFDFDDASELPAAAQLARSLGTEHSELHVRAADVPALLDTLVRCHDEPFADAANIPLYLATRELRDVVKVVLQGDGGDELFAGYRRYEMMGMPIPWRTLRALTTTLAPRSLELPDIMRRILRMIEAMGAPPPSNMALLLSIDSERHLPTQILTPDACRFLASSDPFFRYREVAATLPPAKPLQRMLWADTCILLPDTFLEKVDKPTMANSVEVRVPFLDRALAEYALGLPPSFKVRGRERKRVLKEALRGIVPDAVLDRPKKGFGVPYGKWLRTDLLGTLRANAAESRAVRDRIFNGPHLERLTLEHASGRRDHGFLLWKALQFMLWYEKYPVVP